MGFVALGSHERPSIYVRHKHARGTFDFMVMNTSELRDDLDHVLDQVLATGEPVTVQHNGRQLLIVAAAQPSRLDRLLNRSDVVVGDSADFIHLDWSGESSTSS